MSSPLRATSSPDKERTAILEGDKLLRGFRSGRKSTAADTPAAIKSRVDGSILGQQYSDRKRKESPRVHLPSSILSSAGGDTNPLEVVRTVMFEISSLEQTTDMVVRERIPRLTAMLQGIEEVLENADTSSRGRFSANLFSPAKDEMTDSTPSKRLDTSVLKVYMGNQLELNEAEMDYYEEVVNKLAGQLEDAQEELAKMTDERDDILSTSSMLGERLQRTALEKDTFHLEASRRWDDERTLLLEKSSSLENRVKELLEDISFKDIVIQSRDAEIETKTSQLHILETEKVSAVSSMDYASLEKEITLIRSEMVDKEKHFRDMIQSRDKDIDERRGEIGKLRLELARVSDYDSLQASLQNMTNKYTSAVADLQVAISQRDHFKNFAETELAPTKAAMEESAKLLAAEKRRSSELEASISSLEDAFGKAREIWEKERKFMSKSSPSSSYSKQSQQQAHASPLTDVLSVMSAEPSSEVKRILEEKNLEILYLQKELAKIRSEEGFLEIQTKTTPPKEGFKLRTAQLESAGKTRFGDDEGSDTSVLKVYMNNQLDLNEQEIAYYEEVVNKLAEQLEKSIEDQQNLQAECSQLRETNEELSGKLMTIDSAMSSIANFSDRFNTNCEALMNRVVTFGNFCNDRIDTSFMRLQITSEAMRDAQRGRSELLDLVERQHMDMESLQSKLESEAQSAMNLTAHAKSLESILNTTSNVTQEEFLHFNERLVEAEQRTMEASVQGAKAYAQTARNIAYLEGKVSKLSALVDHYRMVNIKLTGDLKEFHNESLRLKSLEHRLQVISQNEALAKSRIIDLEDTLKNKEKEFLEVRQKTEEVETLRNDEFEYSLRVSAENLKVSQDKNQELMDTIENTQRTYDATIGSLKNEVDRLNERLEELSASTLSADEHTRTLQIKISELQGQLKSSKAEVHLANENAEAKIEAYKKRDKDLTAEVIDLRERYKISQENASVHEEMLMKLRARVDELEDKFVESERNKDAKASEIEAIERELLKSKQTSKKYLEEISKYQDEKNETERALMKLQYELDDLNAKYADLEGVLYKRTADKLAKAEATILSLEDELSSTKDDLNKCSRELQSSKDLYIDLESRYKKSMLEATEAQKREQSLDLKTLDLREEIKVLELQLGEVKGKIQYHKNLEIEMHSKLSKAEAQLESQLQHVLELEANYKSAQANLLIIDNVGDKLAADLIEYLDTLSPVVESMHSSARSEAGQWPSKTPMRDSLECASAGLSNLGLFIEELKSKADFFARQNKTLQDNLDARVNEMSDLKKRCDSLSASKNSSDYEIDRLRSELEIKDSEISMLTNLRSEATKLSKEKNQLVDYIEGTIKDLKGSQENLESALSKLASRTNITLNVSSKLMLGIPRDSVKPSTISIPQLDSFCGHFHEFCDSTERSFEDIVRLVESVRADSSAKAYAVERLEKICEDKETSWDFDRKDLIHKIKSFQDALLSAEGEMNRIKASTNELARNNGELEFELKGVTENNAELRIALSDAEASISELRTRVRSLQNGDESRMKEIESLQGHIEALQRKAASAEIELEKSSSTIMRLRTENNGLETIRRTIEAELARSRDEIHEYRSQPTQSNESIQLSFELEKLLVSIGSTLDQLSPNSLDAKKLQDSASAIVNKTDISIATRVDFVLKRLGDMRSWAREEIRSKRLIEEKCVDLEKELTAMQLRSADSIKALKSDVRAAVDKEIALQEKLHSYSRMESEMKRKNEELEKLTDSLRQVTLQLEDSKMSIHKYAADNQAKGLELERVTEKLKLKDEEYAKMHGKLLASTDKTESLIQEMTALKEEVRIVRSNEHKYNDTCERLQAALNEEKKANEEFKRKNQELELGVATYSKFKAQVTDLETALAKSTETARAYHDAKLVAVEKMEDLERALELQTRRCTQAESALAQSERERTASDQEMASLREHVTEARAMIEREKVERERFQMTASSVRRVKEESRIEVEMKTIQLQQVEERLARADSETRMLRESMEALRLSMSEKEATLTKETDARVRLDHEVQHLKASLDRAQREITSSATRAATLRSQSRRAHTAILDSVAQLKALINIVEVDSATVGSTLDMHSKHTTRSPDKDGGNDDDPFDLQELINVMKRISDVTNWVQSVSKERLDFESTIRKLESERVRLTKERETVDNLHESRVDGIKGTLKIVEDMLGEYKMRFGDLSKADSGMSISDRATSVDTEHKISKLEAQLAYERGEREKAIAEARSLRKKLDEAIRGKGGELDERSMTSELEAVRSEMISARHELNAVCRHRSVLRETVEKLERDLLQQSDALADLRRVVLTELPGRLSHGNSMIIENTILDDDEALRKQNIRYRTRLLALEDLVMIYRVGVIGLFPDGSSYNAAQFLASKSMFNFQDDNVFDSRNSNWVEKELNTIRHSYTEEIRLLETEVQELYGKLRQSSTYTVELKKRFEESLKAMYRHSKNPSIDLLKEELERLGSKMFAVESEAQRAIAELSGEKMLSRKRHASLVDDLVRALQAKDAAVHAVKKLETLCIESGLEHITVYQAFEAELRIEKELTEKIRFESPKSESDYGTKRSPSSDTPLMQSKAAQPVTSLVKSGVAHKMEDTDESGGAFVRSRLAQTSSSYALQTVGSRGSGSLRVGRNLPPTIIPSGSYTMQTPSSYVAPRLRTVNDEAVNDLIQTIDKGSSGTFGENAVTVTPLTLKKKARAVTINLGGAGVATGKNTGR